MNAILDALQALQQKLGLNKDILAKARRRYKRFHGLTENEHARHLRAEAHGHTLRAAFFKRRAEARHTRAVYWRGKVKQEVARINHLEKSIAEREADLRQWHKEHGVLVRGNQAKGGTVPQRLRAAIHRAALNYQKNVQPGYYSQSGAAPSYSHSILHYPYGHRYDCSSWADGIYYCCGLDDPSGTNWSGGFTGTEMANGRQVSRAEARSGDLVIYLSYSGDSTGHHVEILDDPEAGTTMGHGDQAINAGVLDLFGDGLYCIRTYH